MADASANHPVNSEHKVSGLQRIHNIRLIILQLTGSQLAATAIVGALGWLFWAAAARLFPPSEVGFTAAIISGMSLIGALSNLGAGTLLMGELRRHTEHQLKLLFTVLAAVALVGFLAGIGGGFIAPLVSPNLQPITQSVPRILLFALGVSFTVATTVLDQALLGLLRGVTQVTRNFIFAAAKLAMLAALGLSLLPFRGALGDMTIFVTWVASLVLSMLVLFMLPFGQRRASEERSTTARRTQRLRSSMRYLIRTSLSHYALNLGLQIPFYCLPVLVAIVLSTTSNAYFYATWVWGSFIFAVPLALAWSLYSVSAGDPEALSSRIHFTLPLAALVGVATNVVLFPGAHLLLALYGPNYAINGLWCLRLQGLAVFPLIMKDHFVSIRRTQSRTLSAAWQTGLGAALELSGALLGSQLYGLTGTTAGWLLALCVEAVLAAPLVIQTWRADRDTSRDVSPSVQLPTEWPDTWMGADIGLQSTVKQWALKAVATVPSQRSILARGRGGKQQPEPEQQHPAWLQTHDAVSLTTTEIHVLQGESVSIGRSSSRDIALGDHTVSRHHAVIFRNRFGQYLLWDENSANGTFVNGVPVRVQILKDGDWITVGETKMSFHAPDDPGAKGAVAKKTKADSHKT